MIVLQHGCGTADANCEQEAFGPNYSLANGRYGTLDDRRQEAVLARKQLVVDLRKISKRMGASRLTLDHGTYLCYRPIVDDWFLPVAGGRDTRRLAGRNRHAGLVVLPRNGRPQFSAADKDSG